jgi:hypothetical protein
MTNSRDVTVLGCVIGSGCSDKGVVRNGLCVKHYTRKRRTGDPLTEPVKLSVSERFWQKVDKSGDCWTWTGQMHHLGYGRFSVSAGVNLLAHRFAYEDILGSIPSGLELDHLCRNRACVRPEHLDPVTHAVNMGRSTLSGDGSRRRAAQRTHCPQNHPYSGDNLIMDNGARRCRICTNKGQNTRYQRRKGVKDGAR